MNTYHRPGTDRGRADFGWLDSRHSFSFGNYFDPEHMGFGPLRVINEDLVQPGSGFGAHGHRDMEIVTYVLEGALAHRDSLGNGSEIRPGDIQRMTAGTGIRHSEFNASDEEPVRFLQIWILPREEGLKPGYEQRHVPRESLESGLTLLASPDGHRDSVVVHQDARIFGAMPKAGQVLNHEVEPDRRIWVQLISGEVAIDGQKLAAGDGLGLESSASDHGSLQIEAAADSHLLLFDMGSTPAH
jgi:redox-sensitive bicupin YhaK (pirin superfamily)